MSTDYAATYDPDLDFDRHYTRHTVARILERVEPGQDVLELGCATGLMTEELVATGASVVAVDRSAAYLERARARVGDGATFLRADLGDLPPTGPHDHVLLCNVLHELPDPVAVLREAAGRLRPGGLLHASLQNPDSIHRLVAVAAGLLDDAGAVADRGAQWGTLRLYSLDELTALGEQAGLRRLDHAGVMLKPLPNAQMAALPDEVIEGFARVADRFPDHCAMHYVVFGRA